MLRNRFTQLGLLLLLSAVTSVAIAAPQRGKGGGGKNNASLSVSVTPATFSESDAGATGTVTRENSDTSVALTVGLASSDGSEATVQASVQIPVGESSTTFNVTAVNDDEIDGDKSVAISVWAPEHSGAAASITVVDDEGEDPPAQPAVQYRLNLDVVADIPNNYSPNSYSGLNEQGEYVGYLTDYAQNGVRVPFLYDSLSGQVTYINELLDPTSLPSGWSFAAALDINDHGVVVGYATDELGIYHACAIDLAQASPSVDILPTIQGSQSTALKINNAGIILGAEDESWSDVGNWDLCWTLDTGLYGPPATRLATTAEPAIVPVICNALDCDLSEESTTGLTWVGGLEDSEVGDAPFRYAVGDPAVELFSQFAYGSGAFGGINTSGNFAGSATVVTGRKGKRDVSTRLAYRYDSAATGYTTITEEYYSTQDINNFDEVLLYSNGRCGVFRDFGDDMGERLVSLDDLVVGSNPDLSIWFSNNVGGLAMNDAGVIVGSVVDDATGVSYLFSLVPETTSP